MSRPINLNTNIFPSLDIRCGCHLYEHIDGLILVKLRMKVYLDLCSKLHTNILIKLEKKLEEDLA